VDYIVSHYDCKTRRACRLVKQTRSMQYYRSVKDPRQNLRGRMREIARDRVRYGYRRIHVLLRREGWKLGKDQMYRLYREEQLQLRSKLPKRRKMVDDAKTIIEAWRRDYNETRPHMTLKNVAPEEYAQKMSALNAEN